MFVSWILSRLWREFGYRRSLRMLSSLSDRQLEDIGLDRLQITAAAWSQASARAE